MDFDGVLAGGLDSLDPGTCRSDSGLMLSVRRRVEDGAEGPGAGAGDAFDVDARPLPFLDDGGALKRDQQRLTDRLANNHLLVWAHPRSRPPRLHPLLPSRWFGVGRGA